MNDNKKTKKDKGKVSTTPTNVAELKKLGAQIDIKKEKTDIKAYKAEQKMPQKSNLLHLPDPLTRRMNSNVERGRRLSAVAPQNKDDNQLIS